MPTMHSQFHSHLSKNHNFEKQWAPYTYFLRRRLTGACEYRRLQQRGDHPDTFLSLCSDLNHFTKLYSKISIQLTVPLVCARHRMQKASWRHSDYRRTKRPADTHAVFIGNNLALPRKHSSHLTPEINPNACTPSFSSIRFWTNASTTKRKTGSYFTCIHGVFSQ